MGGGYITADVQIGSKNTTAALITAVEKELEEKMIQLMIDKVVAGSPLHPVVEAKEANDNDQEEETERKGVIVLVDIADM